MTASYKTLTDATQEQIINRSRFIAFVYSIEDERDAHAKLQILRKQYYDASHICYALIADPEGTVQKFSDAGEPSGTAGHPILEVLKAGGYRKVLLAVVRYFGGTKLGAGGLVRAYADSAAKCIAKSTVLQFFFSRIYRVKLDFTYSKIIPAFLSNMVCKTLNMRYNESIEMTIAVPFDADFLARLADYFSGKAEAAEQGTGYVDY